MVFERTKSDFIAKISKKYTLQLSL